MFGCMQLRNLYIRTTNEKVLTEQYIGDTFNVNVQVKK